MASPEQKFQKSLRCPQSAQGASILVRGESSGIHACRDHSFLRARGQSGQAVVEYVLILMVVVVVASMIVRQMVSRDPDDPGFVIQKWVEVIDVIRTDSPDTASPPSPP